MGGASPQTNWTFWSKYTRFYLIIIVVHTSWNRSFKGCLWEFCNEKDLKASLEHLQSHMVNGDWIWCPCMQLSELCFPILLNAWFPVFLSLRAHVSLGPSGKSHPPFPSLPLTITHLLTLYFFLHQNVNFEGRDLIFATVSPFWGAVSGPQGLTTYRSNEGMWAVQTPSYPPAPKSGVQMWVSGSVIIGPCKASHFITFSPLLPQGHSLVISVSFARLLSGMLFLFTLCSAVAPVVLPVLDNFWPYNFFQSDATDGAMWAQSDRYCSSWQFWLLLQSSSLSYAY